MSGPGDTRTYDANGVMASVYDPTLRALRISGSGSSGAPVNASYVTMVAESGLSNESVLGTAVIMSGILGSRPAAATAGRLYYATDNGIIYRDTGSTWVAITGAATGVVVLAPATSTDNVIQSSADATELTLKAFAGQTADVLVVKDEEGTDWITTNVTAVAGVINGTFAVGDPNAQLHSYFLQIVEDGTARAISQEVTASSDIQNFAKSSWYIDSNIDGTDDVATLTFEGYESGKVVLSYDTAVSVNVLLIPLDGQTLPLLQIRDQNANDTFRVVQTGHAISNAHAAPADALLNNSDFVFSLDDTPGATFLNCKMKDSGGTVRTFSIPAT